MSKLFEYFIEIAPDIWIGNKIDYINSEKSDQYKYICATNTKNINPCETTTQIKNILYLDLIDANDIKYINTDAIDKAILWYHNRKPKEIFIIFCDQGYSRSPTIAAIFLLIKGDPRIKAKIFEEFLYKFKQIYPEYIPNKGMLDYLKKSWSCMHE
jgi:predicted protein tyrosine phosphatase